MSTIAPAPESGSRGIPRFIYPARILSLCFFSRHDIDAVLDGTHASAPYHQAISPRTLLQQNLDIVRGWFYPASGG
jgi:hypothetical protein